MRLGSTLRKKRDQPYQPPCGKLDSLARCQFRKVRKVRENMHADDKRVGGPNELVVKLPHLPFFSLVIEGGRSTKTCPTFNRHGISTQHIIKRVIIFV